MQGGHLEIIVYRWSLTEKKNLIEVDLILIRHRAHVQAAPGGLLVHKVSVPC